jgi:hypothetical protein
LLTGIAAGSATAGHLFAFRWTSAALVALIQKIKLRWITTTAFTAAQQVSFRLFRLTGYSASHSAGTALTLTGSNLKKATRHPVSAVADIRIGTTLALNSGTHTLDAVELGGLQTWSQVGANLDLSPQETVIDSGSQLLHMLELATNEGFIIRNEVAMGAAGVGQLLVEVDWAEV